MTLRDCLARAPDPPAARLCSLGFDGCFAELLVGFLLGAGMVVFAGVLVVLVGGVFGPRSLVSLRGGGVTGPFWPTVGCL